MTLLLASTGLATQSPAANWWFSSERLEQLSHRPTSHPLRPPSTRGPGISWTSLVLAMMIALTATCLAFVSINGHTGGPPLADDSSADSSDLRGVLEPLQSLALPANQFAPTLVTYEAKAMLGDDRIGLPDFIDTLPPGLDQKIELALPAASADSFSSPHGKMQPVTKRVSRLARVTVYWPEEGDFYTRNRKSSTGVRLRDGHCAVDPDVIPYGSVVHVPSVGPLVAVDTGGAVISRRAAKSAARTPEQRKAIVIDVFCSSRSKAKELVKQIGHFAVVTWQPPDRSAGL